MYGLDGLPRMGDYARAMRDHHIRYYTRLATCRSAELFLVYLRHLISVLLILLHSHMHLDFPGRRCVAQLSCVQRRDFRDD